MKLSRKRHKTRKEAQDSRGIDQRHRKKRIPWKNNKTQRQSCNNRHTKILATEESSWESHQKVLRGFNLFYPNKKGKRKVQGVPQSQTTALPRPQEEEETDKSKQAQTEQTYEKH